jgi:leucyl-tRNA synthetase
MQPDPKQLTGNEPYTASEVEQRWQAAWQESGVFATPTLAEGERGCYIFPVPPFTSGSAHMGHIRSYTLADAYARFRRACGDSVLFSMGFDAFGLPAELGAIRANLHPAEWVLNCSKTMRRQFTALGYSFDWERAFLTSEVAFYKWSQWLFIALLERNLIYRADTSVDWCSSCNTVLARLQVEDGCCWRCHQPVELVNHTQWFVRVSEYLAESYSKLNDLIKWDKMALGAQRSALGKHDGIELNASTIDGRAVKVFTPHHEAIASAAFVAFSPRHPELEEWITTDTIGNQVKSLRTSGWQRSDREAEAVSLVDLELQVVIPGVPRMLPVVVSPSVDSRFGPTAIIGIPDKDTTDTIIAEQLPKTTPSPWRLADDSVSFQAAVRYSAGDFPVSRQRGWGAPIPVIYCSDCGALPVPVDSLPVMLPPDLMVTGTGNALANHPTFAECDCPACGKSARRETDTLDCNFDALWAWLPMCVPSKDRSHTLFTHSELHNWLPVHMVVWGADGGVYMANERVMAKMLRDGGMLDHMKDGEPFERAVMHEMVRFDGRKMSKHLGNVVDPDELVGRMGADTVRFAISYAAAPRNAINWSEQEFDYCHRFILRLWTYAKPRLINARDMDDSQIDISDKLRKKLAKWCDTAIRKVTNDLATLQLHRATRNIIMLLTRIEDFETRATSERGSLDARDHEAIAVALLRLTQLCAPLVPHIAEELWEIAGNEPFVCTANWPIQAVGAHDSIMAMNPSGGNVAT